MSCKHIAVAGIIAALSILPRSASADDQPTSTPAPLVHTECTCADLLWARDLSDRMTDPIHPQAPTDDENKRYQKIAACDPSQEFFRRRAQATGICDGTVPAAHVTKSAPPVTGTAAAKPEQLVVPVAGTSELPEDLPALPGGPPALNFFRIQSENDTYTNSGDRYYTNGLKIETGFDADPHWRIPLPGVLGQQY
ncbi:MAG TPA: hypothetical protein VK989_08165, partial [Polyangia bacterium]|nr:hypothetical protein [Polyangia bacterium]